MLNVIKKILEAKNEFSLKKISLKIFYILMSSQFVRYTGKTPSTVVSFCTL